MRRLLPLLSTAFVFTLQAQQPANTNTSTLKAETSLVFVDASVVSSSGQPIKGLQASDFSIKENGVAQQITSVSYAPPLVRADPKGLHRGEFSNRNLLPHEGTMTLILLDEVNTAWEDQAQARQQLQKYLRQHAADVGTVFLLVLDDRLRLVSTYSLAPGEEHAAEAQARELNKYYALGTTGDDVPERRVGETSLALQMIARATRDFHGRKNLIWITAGFPTLDTTGEEGRKLGDLLSETVNALSSARITLYVIDPRGQPLPPVLSGQDSTAAAASGDLFRVASTRSVMRHLAEDTGGKLCASNNMAACIVRDIEEGSFYYVLTYKPTDNKLTREFRKIEVAVARPGAIVVARKGYYALSQGELYTPRSPEEEMSYAMWNPLPMRGLIYDADPKISSDQLRVRVRVDFATVTPASESSPPRAHFQVQAAQFSKRGSLLKSKAWDVDVPLDEAGFSRATKEGVPLELAEPREKQATRLRLVIRDVASGHIGTLDLPLHPS